MHQNITNEFAARQALKAREAIATAIPIYPLPHEVVRGEDEPFQSPHQYHGEDPDSFLLEAEDDLEHEGEDA